MTSCTKILSPSEIQRLFYSGLQTDRDRALFGICLFSACRIREACTLRTADVFDTQGRVLTKLIIRKGNTKGKLATRTIPIIDDLRRLLINQYCSDKEKTVFIRVYYARTQLTFELLRCWGENWEAAAIKKKEVYTEDEQLTWFTTAWVRLSRVENSKTQLLSLNSLTSMEGFSRRKFAASLFNDSRINSWLPKRNFVF